MFRAKIQGATVLELLISSGLLLLLSGLFFGVVLPPLKRQAWLAQKQTTVTQAMVARARLRELLYQAQLIPPGSESATSPDGILEFRRPATVQTADFATLARFDRGEILNYQDSRNQLLRLTGEGEFFETDSETSYRRVIWFLGPQSEVQAEPSEDARRVRFTFRGLEQPNTPQQSSWTREFTIFLD